MMANSRWRPRVVGALTAVGLLYASSVGRAETPTVVPERAPRTVSVEVSVVHTEVAANGRAKDHLISGSGLTVPNGAQGSLKVTSDRGEWSVEAAPYLTGDGRATLTMSYTWQVDEPGQVAPIHNVSRLEGTKRLSLDQPNRFFVLRDPGNSADRRVMRLVEDPKARFPATGQPYSVDCVVVKLHANKRPR